MSKQRDPRLIEKTRIPSPKPKKPKVAPAEPVAPVAKPLPPTTDMETPRPNGKGKGKTKVARSKRKKVDIGERPAWFKKLVYFLAGLAVLYFVYFCVQSINNTLKQNQRNEAITTVWRQLLSSNTTIQGTPTILDESGSPNFPSISFESSRTRADLHRNLRLATALPGVRSMDVSPESTGILGGGVADDTTLMLVAANFNNLDMLSLSGTRVTSLEALAETSVRELRLVNTTIKREKLGSLEFVDGVTDLWIGWNPDPRNPDHEIFRSPLYKQRMIDAIKRMPNLQNLYVYRLSFTTEERKELGQLNIKSLRDE